MARNPLTDQQIEAFRARAVAAATRLFAERGYEGVSMRSLAADLGVSAMTAYRYFDDKDALFAAVRTAAFGRFGDRQQAVADRCLPERLSCLATAYMQFAVDEPEAYRIMFELKQSPTADYPELEAAQKRAYSFLFETVSEAIAAGFLRGDPATTAHLLWARVHGLVSLHLAGKLIMGRSFEQLSAAITSGAAAGVAGTLAEEESCE